jgi:hypothetical protein
VTLTAFVHFWMHRIAINQRIGGVAAAAAFGMARFFQPLN